jgi:hypothetical protein
MDFALIVSPVQLGLSEVLEGYSLAVQDVLDGRSTAEEALSYAQRQSPFR